MEIKFRRRLTFQSTRSLRSATVAASCGATRRLNFNPRAPCGARHTGTPFSTTSTVFQSTRSLRSATWLHRWYQGQVQNFNPRAPCGARLFTAGRRALPKLISIHALLAERDDPGTAALYLRAYFNPRAPCGARHRVLIEHADNSVISIHALLAERDVTVCRFTRLIGIISIHALLAERDDLTRLLAVALQDFNPRAPCGARQAVVPIFRDLLPISIHALLAERDGDVLSNPLYYAISIHALLAERDRRRALLARVPGYDFNPRAPCGARLFHGCIS